MTSLLVNLIVQKCEEPRTQERDHIPDHQAENECR
jgi:hypothetical protein